jgi:hypothetical protein
VRHEVTSALLQAGEPVALGKLAAECKATEEEVGEALRDLVARGLVVEGRLVRGAPAAHYCWGATWAREIERRTAAARRKLREIVPLPTDAPVQVPNVSSEAAVAFCDFVTKDYHPPEDKTILVFLQCSVRRPFSSSPSHASMRRAISLATGFDPGADFVRCPVHVVVMASTMGPVPYEFEELYPANVRAGGVKHLDDAHYARVKPILAERMAQYLMAHRDSYDHVTTFTEGRYAEVMAAAREMACAEFPILPAREGPRVVRIGDSTPRTYWQKYWIQLYLHVVGWLPPGMRAAAAVRLKEAEVEYEA